jgi:tRNA pseudouridine38-40 synthase
MKRAAPFLLGRHDYSAFRAANCQARHAVRMLRKVDVESLDVDELAITVEGSAFLKHMVRNIVGTLVEVGVGRWDPWRPLAVLDSRDRSQAGRTAPPQGLTLTEVDYGPNQ